MPLRLRAKKSQMALLSQRKNSFEMNIDLDFEAMDYFVMDF